MNLSQITETLEQEARRLRESIYGPIPDHKWEYVKEVWIADIDWLRANAK